MKFEFQKNFLTIESISVKNGKNNWSINILKYVLQWWCIHTYTLTTIPAANHWITFSNFLKNVFKKYEKVVEVSSDHENNKQKYLKQNKL